VTVKRLEPGAVLGVLGGGQLGAMFAEAAGRMGYHVAVWDPDALAPAHRLASHSITAPFSDLPARETFAQAVDAVTFEWENVPAELCAWLEQRHPVRPGSAVLELIQDRIKQKQFLASQSLPVPSFAIVDAPDQLPTALDKLGYPAICKTATTGYDGKGQWIIRQATDVPMVQHALEVNARSGFRWIVETLVPFQGELSVLVVREVEGACETYPVVENRHEHGILRLTLAPASISPALSRKASELARHTVTAMNGIGVFCVELFQRMDGELLINEVAPRPHNSGHYTLDACTVSQFEQQVRVLCGLPIGEVRLLCPAAMVNVIGEELQQVTAGAGHQDLLAIPGAVLRLYGKRVVRAGRKMGHVTFLADRSEVAAGRAIEFAKRLS
jgi:5-(carboxyamino)imidazole ribonucleotide synthase